MVIASTLFSGLINKPVMELISTQLNLLELYKSVYDCWEPGEGWKWDHLNGIIPAFAEEKLTAFFVREDETCGDGFFQFWQEGHEKGLYHGCGLLQMF